MYDWLLDGDNPENFVGERMPADGAYARLAAGFHYETAAMIQAGVEEFGYLQTDVPADWAPEPLCILRFTVHRRTS